MVLSLTFILNQKVSQHHLIGRGIDEDEAQTDLTDLSLLSHDFKAALSE